jgi:hypothetical protein
MKIDRPPQPFETAKTLELLPFPFAKPSQIVPSISLKTKGNFGRKEPFHNVYLLRQVETLSEYSTTQLASVATCSASRGTKSCRLGG